MFSTDFRFFGFEPYRAMAEDETTALKAVLWNQFLLMERLYTELEEEREASASGAEEALSMILRLQKEKAEEMMEHCQYRKMAEAKMQHAEESLAMFEQLLFQNEIENASLRYQLEVYRNDLLSMGVKITDVSKAATVNNRFFSRSTACLERTGSSGIFRRQISLPTIPLINSNTLRSEMEIVDGDTSLLDIYQYQKPHFSRETVIGYRNSDSERVQEGDTSVNKLQQTEEIKQLTTESNEGSRFIWSNNESDKNITIDPQSYHEGSRSSLWHSSGSGNQSTRNNRGGFEILQSHKGSLHPQSSMKVPKEPPLKAEWMPVLVQQESLDTTSGDDVLANKAHRSLMLRNGISRDYQSNFVESESRPSVEIDAEQIKHRIQGVSRDHQSNFVESESIPSSVKFDVEQLKQRIQQLEVDLNIMKQSDLKCGKRRVKLLKVTHERSDTVQSHARNSISNKPSSQDVDIFVSLTEAMLSFSI